MRADRGSRSLKAPRFLGGHSWLASRATRIRLDLTSVFSPTGRRVNSDRRPPSTQYRQGVSLTGSAKGLRLTRSRSSRRGCPAAAAGRLFGVVALVGSHEAEAKGQIVLHNLYCRYAPSEPEVLRGVSVLIDGQPLSRWNAQSLRSQIALVAQDDSLL